MRQPPSMLPAVMAVDAVLRVYAQTRFLLIMNLVRFAFVAAFVGGFLDAFGLRGAVFVTLLAMAVTKILGVARIAWLLGVGVGEALPWRRLAGLATIATVSAAPMLWLQRSVSWHPLVTFLAGASLYVGVYALLSFQAIIRAWLRPTATIVAPANACALHE